MLGGLVLVFVMITPQHLRLTVGTDGLLSAAISDRLVARHGAPLVLALMLVTEVLVTTVLTPSSLVLVPVLLLS